MTKKIHLILWIGTLLIVACEPATPPTATVTPIISVVASAAPVTPVKGLSPYAITRDNAQDVTQLASWGQGTPNDVRWSPDGKTLAIRSTQGIYLYDAQSLTETGQLFYTRNIIDYVFSPDSRSLALIGCSPRDLFSTSCLPWYRLIDIATNDVLYTVSFITPNIIPKLKFNPDGRKLFVSACSGVSEVDPGLMTNPDRCSEDVLVLDTRSGKKLDEFTNINAGGDMDLSPDGRYLAAIGDSMVIWDLRDRRIAKTISPLPDGAKFVAFSQDGSKIYISSWEGNLTSWSLESGKQIWSARQDILDALPAFAVDRVNDQVILAFWQTPELQFWNMGSGKLERRIQPMDFVNAIAVNPQANEVVGVGRNKILVWDTETGTLLRQADWPTTPALVASGSMPNGNWVVLSATNNEVEVLEAITNKVVWKADISMDVPKDLAWAQIYHVGAISPDGRFAALGSEYGPVRIWELESGKLLAEFRLGLVENNLAESPTSVAFSPDSRLLAAGGYSGTLQLWHLDHLEQGITKTSLDKWSGSVDQLFFTPDGQRLISISVTMGPVGYNQGLRVWDIKTGNGIYEMQDYEFWNSVLSPDGNTLISVTPDDRHAAVMDLGPALRSPQIVTRAPYLIDMGPRGYYQTFAFNPNGSVVALGFTDHNGNYETYDSFDARPIVLWDLSKEDKLRDLGGTCTSTSFLAFSPDGQYLVSSGNDGIICLWGIQG